MDFSLPQLGIALSGSANTAMVEGDEQRQIFV
jgi:hypothetical protein